MPEWELSGRSVWSSGRVVCGVEAVRTVAQAAKGCLEVLQELVRLDFGDRQPSSPGKASLRLRNTIIRDEEMETGTHT